MNSRIKNIALLFIDAFIIAVLSVIGVAFFWHIIDAVDLFNPLDEYFEDYDYTDRYFAKIVDENIPICESIFIVNIGYLSRGEIAQKINIIQSFNPAIIGIDAVLKEERDSINDYLLQQTLLNQDNILLGCFGIYEKNEPSGIIRSHEKFGEHPLGHLEFISEDISVRVFETFIEFNDTVINSFPVEIVRMYDEEKYHRFMLRNKQIEVINYRGGKEPFKVFDFEDINSDNPDLKNFEDKIVLMAYYREYAGAPCDTIDSHFSPVSRSEYGYADTKGIEIHAHVINMILKGDFIEEISEVKNYAIAFIVCFLFQLWMISYFKKGVKYFDMTSKPLLFIVIIINMWIVYQIFAHFKIKIDMIPTNLVLFLSGEVFRFYEETSRLLKIKTYITK
jgi:CHASE2 domain-containing sensor protein